jgi:hypothetical protein
MPFAGTARRAVVTTAAVLGVLAVAGATVAWQAGGASATPARPLVAAQAGPAATPSTLPTTTSSTSTSTSTSTTVKPKPVPTTAATPRTTVPKPAAPAPAAPAWTPPVAQSSGTSAAERCAAAQQWVAQHGLALPAGWGFRCPGTALVGGAERWGVACWNCEGNGSNWIAVDIGRIGASDATLRYVIAHETCHAMDYMALGLTTEVGADLCAGLHGAPRP